MNSELLVFEPNETLSRRLDVPKKWSAELMILFRPVIQGGAFVDCSRLIEHGTIVSTGKIPIKKFLLEVEKEIQRQIVVNVPFGIICHIKRYSVHKPQGH